MSENPEGQDYFDRARAFAATGLVVTGALAVVGCFLKWVTFSLVEAPGTHTTQSASAPIVGTKVSDWKAVFAAGVVVIIFALLLVIRKRSRYAWICFLASMVIGAIAVADYRGLGDPTSGFLRGLEHALHTTVQGRAQPGIGLTLVAISGVGGLIASIVGIAASPHRH
ncbi:MAG: hypothetical protein QOH48_1386 [Actinomycetota bacterium]|nr:hypothetical protein [Actinomycetota bacterium]